jgi:two-component system sensor histidine kinase AlgZ
MRFGPRLIGAIDVADPGLLRALVPPLLLQPLVENSFLHGLARRTEGGRVDVQVDTVFDDMEWLRLRVIDDGPGADPNSIFHRGSLGIPNAKARLEALYGAQHSFGYAYVDGRFVADVRIALRLAENA